MSYPTKFPFTVTIAKSTTSVPTTKDRVVVDLDAASDEASQRMTPNPLPNRQIAHATMDDNTATRNSVDRDGAVFLPHDLGPKRSIKHRA